MAFQSHSFHNTIKMTNGVLGLSILTMPFCFEQVTYKKVSNKINIIKINIFCFKKKCGLLLGTLCLLICAFLTSYSCKLLVEAANIQKRNSIEYLAYSIFGYRGKLMIELSIIFLLYGSLISYQQIVNDTGPIALTRLFEIKVFDSISFCVFFFIKCNLIYLIIEF